MNKCFATIITSDYLPYANALLECLTEYCSDINLYVLVSDSPSTLLKKETHLRLMTLISYEDLIKNAVGQSIHDKYYESYHDAFRWSMKPVLIGYLLDEYEKVIYVDCDVHFFNDHDFLFKLLDKHNILLSPHFRSSDPVKDSSNFFLQFNAGLFNGGFVAANKGGKEAMIWWAKACDYICEKSPCKGQFDDQTHLNLLPVFFEDVHIIKHRGCNVANWNLLECERTFVENELLINKEYPLVFIHFTGSTIRGIINGNDSMLRPHFDKYNERLLANGLDESLFDKYSVNAIPQPSSFKRFVRFVKKQIRFTANF
ncbi:glycosyltransferase [Roseivirga sp.]|uniref:glycosyltransferase n=1 Tax=Roseivirga sp. TaxID=1964215 RepID=UPI003B8C0652